MEEDYLLVSGIQHFSFCRRQWGLIHIENYWQDNMLTAEGHIFHDRTNDERLVTRRNGIITLRGLRIKSDQLGIIGICDVVELIPDETGINLQDRPGKWRIHPVEYKHGQSKANACDRLQLAAECMCLEEMLLCRIDTGSLFYGKTRHREEIDINDELRASVESIVKEMWNYYNRHYTPKVKPRSSCKSCSLKEYCMPELERKNDVSKYIRAHLYEEKV